MAYFCEELKWLLYVIVITPRINKEAINFPLSQTEKHKLNDLWQLNLCLSLFSFFAKMVLDLLVNIENLSDVWIWNL